jgi:hypothetical protein
VRNGGDKNRIAGMEAGGWKERGDGEGEGGRGEGTYSVHIGQAHFPSERRSGKRPVTEVAEVMVCWTSHPLPGPELVVATISSERSSSPSSSVLRLRSMTSPLVAGGTFGDATRCGSRTIADLSSSWPSGR